MINQMSRTSSNPTSKRRSALNEAFRKFAAGTSHAAGTSWAFIAAMLIIVLWGATGPLFHYSDTWQLVINTGTTIITFLMVFLIQNTQNRSDKATQVKLDELIRGVEGARTSLVNLEDLSDEDLDRLKKQFAKLHQKEAARTERDGEKDDDE